MSQKTIEMNQVKQVQQLFTDGVAIKEIVRRTGISRKTVRKYLRKLDTATSLLEGKSVGDLSDKELAVMVYDHDPAPVGDQRFQALVHHFEANKKALHKTGVTKQLLWIEYLAAHPGGYQYSQYCYWFKKHLKDTDPAFHWEYTPGEFIQVDFAGKKLSYVNKDTGEVIACEVFVAIFPYSGFIFCMAVASQKTHDFAHCINETLKYAGGVTSTVLCDNLRTAVTRADPYEPVFTELCIQLSAHYTTTFSATRPAEPKDKAMVESAVNIVYNNIYGPMHKDVPGSLEELNTTIRHWLNKLNEKPYKGTRESRRDIYDRDERALLKGLPETPYYLKKRKEVTVMQNYYLRLPDNGHYYSVPYEYVGCKVWAYFDSRMLEVYYRNERIALHGRSSTEPKYSLIRDHMPPHHAYMKELRGWTVEDLLERAARIGAYTHQAADRLLHSSIYPPQNFRACNAMILLKNKYTKERLEAACRRAANVPRPTLAMIRKILEAGLDRLPLLFDEQEAGLPVHANIRGRNSYQ